ncbi:DNA-binding NarL/FixJ family response regulator [Motilibacter peucedani]|uniref:DNA-binding NarL/FixJ family response regulator n=1 Tax=Motilibacter peucedani TaxID=598650 RepID=A0A420XRS5_9ACTN|nr:response regulator transcription factor [Motilibacter peucedani]RKS77606.1 DNA-binding NarL/FixJ family response regulator [Motilibacter peucedani]
MMRIPVRVQGRDPIIEAGVASSLRPCPEIRVVGADDPDTARVAVVVVDAVDDEALRLLRLARRGGTARAVLVAGRLDEGTVSTAVESGALGLVRRSEATPARLLRVIKAADVGQGSVPPDLLGRLLQRAGERSVPSQRSAAPAGGPVLGAVGGVLADREVEVLRLVADGYDTAEIARTMSYSERTIKNVLHDVMSRLQLRNRSHAVAYALRQGLI